MVDQEAFYRNVVHSLRNGVIAIWRDGSIAVVNDAAYRILGVTASASHIGRPLYEVLGRDHDLTEVLSLAFTDTALPNRAELRLRSSGKTIGYTLCRIADRDGTVSGAALLFKDLTRVEQLEERERLRDRLAALGEMAAAIAHEVKNPLAGIQVVAGVLKRQLPESPDAHELLNDIINEAKMANQIVVQVLEFVRPMSLQVESVSITTVVDDAIATLRGLPAAGRTTIAVDRDTQLPRFDGDRLQLRQLFTNLLTNAVEAMMDGGHIWVTFGYAAADEPTEPGEQPDYAGYVTVEVSDDGPGIPDEVTEQMFSPFFTTKPRGTGLGLAIVRKIVNAHDGRIDIRPRAEGGTRFRVRLPVSRLTHVTDTTPSDNRTAGRTHV
ncbi:MAG TPA: PAS domain-containing protein [Acidobacteria bacterium]|nr:PAS domain-containing protein [Acidobacteriota bacterium]